MSSSAPVSVPTEPSCSHQWAFAYGRVPTEAALIHLAAQLLDDLAKVCHVFLNDPSRVA